MQNLTKILLLCLVSHTYGLSLAQIQDIFGDKDCIPGSLLSLGENIPDVKKIQVTSSQVDFVENMITHSDGDKSAMSSINELAQYNEISYTYELVDEQGPAHGKIFTIKLFLGDEEYLSEGKSLKKAQQSAASIALKNTKFGHPPVRIKENEKALTPTVLLNNLATKLGLEVSYSLVDDILEDLESNREDDNIKPHKSYLQKLNDTVHSNSTIHIRKDGSDVKGPFKVRVNVNGAKFIGKAHTIQNAKHEAAVKALKSLKNNEENFHCLKEGDCKSVRNKIQSPISLVYEAAQKRNLGVTFDVIDEVGPPHKKIFTTKCVVGNLEATGEGRSKKESKKLAAENILQNLLNLPEVKGTHTNLNTNSKKKRKNKKNKVIKTTFDKIDRMFDDAMDFGKSLINKIKGDEDNGKDDSKSQKNNKNKNIRSPSEEIIKLGNILSLEIQFSDFLESDKTFSVLDLGTKPAFICLGEGINRKNSRDLAAKHGINILYKLGLLENLLDKSMKISTILDKEEAYENFWVEVVEDKNEL